MTISDVVFKNFYGTSSKKYDPKAGTLICSAPDVSSLPQRSIYQAPWRRRLTMSQKCNNIRAENITITTPSGASPQWICNNVQNNLLDINCVSS